MKATKQQALVPWIIWFALLQSSFAYHFFLGDGFPSGPNAPEPMAVTNWIICFAPLVAATLIRWFVITRLKEPKHMLVAMIIGLGLSEAAILMEIFLMNDYPQYQIAVLIVALVSIIQFAPSYSTPGYNISKSVDER